MQIYNREQTEQKSVEKLDLRGSWAVFRRGWERFREGFGASWGLLGRFGALFLHACFWSGLQKCSWRHLGWILARFYGVWHGFWKGFGRNLGRFWQRFVIILGGFGLFWAILGYQDVCGRFLDGFGLLWLALARFGLLLACFGLLWLALTCLGLPWPALACFGLLWLALPCFDLLWLALACLGLLCFAWNWF